MRDDDDDDDHHAAVAEALDTLLTETGQDVEALFGDWVLGGFEGVSPTAARAAGIIEGAGIAMGLTALELLERAGSSQRRLSSQVSASLLNLALAWRTSGTVQRAVRA